MSKNLGHYYDDEKGGYVEVHEEVFRGKIVKLEVFYPAPKEYSFEKVNSLFIEQLNNELFPRLKEIYLNQTIGEIDRNKT